MIINERNLSEAVTNVIRTDKTGVPFYDNFLNKKDSDYMKLAKGLKGEIVKMTPQHYLDELPKIFHCSKAQAVRGIDDKYTAEYVEMMKSGTKFNLPYLNYAQDTQEGRHRALAALKLGVPTIPVLVVTKYDPKKELGLVGSMRLWYGHTLEYEDKSGHTVSTHVGLDEDAMKKEVEAVKRSRNYQ